MVESFDELGISRKNKGLPYKASLWCF